MARNGMLRHGPCPFVNENDGRCSCRMTKQTLSQAFDFCLGGRHFTCQTYHAISWERRADCDESETELQPGPPTQLPITPGIEPEHPAARPAARLHGYTDDQQAVA